MKRKLIAVLVMACLLFAIFAGAQEKFRLEKDLLSKKQIRADASFVVYSSALKSLAVKLSKISSMTTVGIVTALNPVLGYEKATELANEAYTSGKGILEIIREKKILTEAQIRRSSSPVKLSGLDRGKYQK